MLVRKSTYVKACELIEKLDCQIKALEAEIAEIKRAIAEKEQEVERLAAENEKLHKYDKTVEQLALAIATANIKGVGILEIRNVDPDNLFEWGAPQ